MIDLRKQIAFPFVLNLNLTSYFRSCMCAIFVTTKTLPRGAEKHEKLNWHEEQTIRPS